MTYNLPSYCSIFNLGHKQVQNIFEDPCEITAKIDGSQISFCKLNGKYFVRSKGKNIIINAPDKLFSKAIESILKLDLKEGWVYRGEYLNRPKHNVLCYERVPQNNVILFNIERTDQDYLTYEEMTEEGKRIGLEVVPLLFRGKIESLDQVKLFLNRDAYLGGCKEEGIVIKNYQKFGSDKKILMTKLVREEFKEIHSQEWKKSNPSPTDIIQEIILSYKTPPRYQKALQHLKENGKIENSPKDIGELMKEVPADILKECEDEIKQKLFDYFWPKIRRAVVSDIPNWYKDLLVKQVNFN